MKYLAMTLLLCLTLSGCCSLCSLGMSFQTYAEKPSCNKIIEQMNGLHCEDAVLQGYTAAYLGHEEWKKITDAYYIARQKHGTGCDQYWGGWLGRQVYKGEK